MLGSKPLMGFDKPAIKKDQKPKFDDVSTIQKQKIQNLDLENLNMSNL